MSGVTRRRRTRGKAPRQDCPMTLVEAGMFLIISAIGVLYALRDGISHLNEQASVDYADRVSWRPLNGPVQTVPSPSCHRLPHQCRIMVAMRAVNNQRSLVVLPHLNCH